MFATDLAPQRSAGIVLGVKLGSLLHAFNKARKPGMHPSFETQGRHHQWSNNNRKNKCLAQTYVVVGHICPAGQSVHITTATPEYWPGSQATLATGSVTSGQA